MKIRYQTGQCPNCGATISIGISNSHNYGSPLQTCPKCSKIYVDKTFHEIEIEGIRECDVSTKGSAGLMVGSAIAAIVSLLLFSFISHLGLIVVFLFSVIAFVYTIVDAIKIKSGKAKAELEAERQKSIQRLQNKEYAHAMKQLGYNVPEKYL